MTDKPFNGIHGFTLMELMIVIAIIAISTGIVLDAILHWVPKYRLKQAAWDLFSHLQRTRAAAIQHRAEYAVRFATDDNAYHLLSGGPNRKYDGPVAGSDDRLVKTVFLSDYGSGVRFGHGTAVRNATTTPASGFPDDGVSFVGNTTIFSTDGMTFRMGYVYLQNNRDAVFAVATPTMAGLVRLMRWDGRQWQ